ncbi:MAG: lipid II flippase MurJ [Patescibacteria group bacterium]
MVRKFFAFFERDIGSLHQAAYVLAFSSFASQILALFRDRLLAHNFGAGPELDVYYAAFRVQDFIFVSVASFLSFAVLIPFLVERVEEGKDSLRRFTTNVFSFSSLALLVASSCAFLFAPQLSSWLFPGIRGEYHSHLISMMRILLLSPFLLSLSNLLGAVSQSLRKYYLFALSPVLYNLGIIIGIYAFYLPTKNLSMLAWGVILGAFLHLLVQLPFALREGFFPLFSFRSKFLELKEIVSLSFLRAVSLASGQIVLLVLLGIASVLGAGAISILSLSNNLQSILLSLIGASYSVAAFPVLARFFGSGEKDHFIREFSAAARHIIFWALPGSIFFIVLRAQIVRVAYGTGAFSWDDTRLTAAALSLFMISITAQCLSLLCLRSYYATKNSKRPLIITIISSLATIAACYGGLFLFRSSPFFANLLEALFRVSGIPGTEVLMLPLAFSLGAILNALLFFLFFKKDFGVSQFEIGATAYHAFAGGVFGGFIAYQTLTFFGEVLDLNTFLGVFLQGTLAGISGIFASSLLLFALKNKEFFEMTKAFKSRFKKEILIPPQESLLE